MNLYDVARDVCHENGIEWTDPRTGVVHPVPAWMMTQTSGQFPQLYTNLKKAPTPPKPKKPKR